MASEIYSCAQDPHKPWAPLYASLKLLCGFEVAGASDLHV